MEPKKEEEPKKEVEQEKKEESGKEEPKKEEVSKKEEPEKKEEPKKEESKTIKIEDSDYTSTDKTWDDLGVKENIKTALVEMNFIFPSKIQSTTFPLIMKEPRETLLAQAKNGSGKTGAFGLGVISSIDENNPNIQAVIFAHSRELVIQIKDILSQIAAHTQIKVTAILPREEHTFGQVIVMTPGMFDNLFLKRKKNSFENLKMLVLDEADFLLTNDTTGPIIKKTFNLFQKASLNVQVLFFSATFDDDCKNFVKQYYKSYKEILLKQEELSLDNVRQFYHICKTQEEKVDFIEEYLKVNANSERVIIFVNTKNYLIQLQEKLRAKNYKVFVLMGGEMDPKERDETIRRFKSGQIQILITTNVLARGYDEKLVKLVINFDLPVKRENNAPIPVADTENYLHRIGRTGRFGTKGIGLSLCYGKNEESYIKSFESFYKTKIEELTGLDQLIEELKNLTLEKH